MNKLVCVVGQHRGGTSLTCDLVTACGYCFGDYGTHDLRDARHEHPQRIGSPDQTVEDTRIVLSKWEAAKINAVKLTKNLDMWLTHLPFLVENLKVICITRSPIVIAASRQSGHPYTYSPTESSLLNIAAEQGAMIGLLQNTSIPTLYLDFCRVLLQEKIYLQYIPRFLDSNVSIHTLINLIDPETPQHQER